MRKNLGYLLLASILLCGGTANAELDTILVCHEKIQILSEGLGLEEPVSKSDDIRQCVEEMLNLNSGEIALQKSGDSCDSFFGCSLSSSWISSYDAEDFIKLLRKNFKEDEIKKIDEYQDKALSFDERIKKSHEDFVKIEEASDYKEEEGEYFASLEYILKDTIEVYVKAEIESMGVSLESSDGQTLRAVDALLKGFDACLKPAKTDRHIKICTQKFKINAPFRIGKIIVSEYLKEYFELKLSKTEYSGVEELAEISYASCGIDYYLNPSEDLEEVDWIKRVKVCAYKSLVTAFLKSVDVLLSNQMQEGDGSALMAAGLTSKCDSANLYISNEYEDFEGYTVAEFKDLLLSCVDRVEIEAVSSVAAGLIAENESVMAIVDVENLEVFTVEVLKEALPVCLERLPEGMKPEDCRNYLFAISSEKLFALVLREKIESYKDKFSFIQNFDEIIKEGVAESKKCNKEIYDKDFKGFLEMSEDSIGIRLAECLKKGIIKALQSPLGGYIDIELDGNEILEKYDVVLGDTYKKKIKSDFNVCISGRLSAENGFESILETSKTFLEPCILESFQKVTLHGMGLVLRKALRSMGISSKEAGEILKEYEEADDSVFVDIQNAESVKEIEGILFTADKEIIKDISEYVIKFLIKKKSPIRFSKRNMRVLIAEGKRSLISCLEEQELNVCSEEVEKDVMELGIRIYLPDPVSVEIADKIYPLISGDRAARLAKIKGLKIRALFASRIETRAGRRLSRLLARKLIEGASISQIKETPEVLTFVYETLSSSSSHMNSISYYMIQPAINKELSGFFAGIIFSGRFRRSGDWRSLRRTRSGKIAMGLFLGYMRGAVVEGRSLSMDTIVGEMKGPLKDGMFEYSRIIRKYCKQSRGDEGYLNQEACYNYLDRVDQSL